MIKRLQYLIVIAIAMILPGYADAKPPLWKADIVVTYGENSQRLTFGADSIATDGFDNPFEVGAILMGSLRVYFDHPEWGIQRYFWQDIKDIILPKEWKFYVATTYRTLVLDWQTENVPSTVSLHFTDESTGKVIDMKAQESYTYTSATSEPRVFRIKADGYIEEEKPTDATPPDTLITDVPDFIKTSEVTINYSGSDDVTDVLRLEFSYRVDDGAWSAWSVQTSAALEGLTEGVHTFEVRSIDEAGNIDPSPAMETFTVDTTPPDTLITTFIDAYVKTSSITLDWTGSDNITPKARLVFSYRVDNGAWSVWDGSTNAVLSLQDGPHTFEVKSKDEAGWEDTGPATARFVVDTMPPVVTLNKSLPETLWPPNKKMVNVIISGNAQDAGSGVSELSYMLSDEYGELAGSGAISVASNGDFSFGISLRAWRDGSDMDGRIYTIAITAKDRVGYTTKKLVIVIVPHDQRK